MGVNKDDLAEGKANMAMILGNKSDHGDKPGKYPVDQKMYHHIIVLVSAVAIVTGLLMMVRVDTPFWERNPYLLADGTWGWIYVAHGLGAVALVGLVITHVYFAVLPEKRWLTWSMIHGRISRDKYAEHHDPERWTARD